MRSRWLKHVLIALASIYFIGTQAENQIAFAQAEEVPPVIEGGWVDFSGATDRFQTAEEACLQGYSPRHIELWTDKTNTHPYGSITRAYCGIEGGYERGYGLIIQAACWASEAQAGNTNIFPLDYVFIGDLGGGICVLPSFIGKLIEESQQKGNPLHLGETGVPINYTEVQDLLAETSLPTSLPDAGYTDIPTSGLIETAVRLPKPPNIPPAARTPKVPRPGLSGKEAANNAPSWARNSGKRPYVGESGKDFAKRLMDEQYGKVNHNTGPGSEFNQIKKWGDRAFQNP